MAGDDTLAKALADVRQRRADLQSDHERIVTELTKLRTAEKSLAAIVEGGPGAEVDLDTDFAAMEVRSGSPKRGRGRGSRGPRANSAKGRLKALLEQTGPQGLSHAELERRLPDVAPNTLNTYLSMMVTGGRPCAAAISTWLPPLLSLMKPPPRPLPTRRTTAHKAEPPIEGGALAKLSG